MGAITQPGVRMVASSQANKAQTHNHVLGSISLGLSVSALGLYVGIYSTISIHMVTKVTPRSLGHTHLRMRLEDILGLDLGSGAALKPPPPLLPHMQRLQGDLSLLKSIINCHRSSNDLTKRSPPFELPQTI